MKTIALAHEITDERVDYLDSLPIDTIEEFCDKNGYKIDETYYESTQLEDDIIHGSITPSCIIFHGLYEEYNRLESICMNKGIDLISVFEILV